MTGQHVLVNEEKVGKLALADAASLIFDEHLPGAVDGIIGATSGS